MPEVHDELRSLFRATGHAGPAADLTDRIMAQVAVTPVLRPGPVKPILGRGAWVTIGALIAGLLLWSVLGGSGDATNGVMNDAWKPLIGVLSSSAKWAFWLVGISASLILLAVVDRALAGRHRST